MNRRDFLATTSLSVGAAALLSTNACTTGTAANLSNWQGIREQFLLTHDKIQMSQFLLASHPAPVRAAIDKYRKELDNDTADYFENNFISHETNVIKAASEYLGAGPGEIALTDSTTMGLAILYGGLKLKEGDEILSTTHDHYSTEKSLDFAAKNTGASLRRIDLYDEGSKANVDEILGRLKKAIKAETRIVAVTFVHSSTGVKLPISEMSKVIKEANANRGEDDRIYFCVDAVHGFGVEDITVEQMGCDFLVAGTHKWLFGPRGTGIVWAKKDAWDMVDPVIPPFSIAYLMWMNTMPEGPLDFYSKITPGGFHSFEYRWALNEAFQFHLDIGKAKIQKRTHELNTMMKNGIKEMSHVKLHTPMSTELSSGINCFEVDGMTPTETVKKLHDLGIVGSTTPYKTVYARLTPCILNTEEEVQTCLNTLAGISA